MSGRGRFERLHLDELSEAPSPDPLRPAETDEEARVRGTGCVLAGLGYLVLVAFVIGVVVGRASAPGSGSQATPTVAGPEPLASGTPAGSSEAPKFTASVLGATGTPRPTRRPTPRPTLQARHGRLIVRGVATMTDTRCAAAGPALRDALGAHWRGTPVRVWFRGESHDTWLCDWCACRDRPGGPTVIDLPPWMFAAFGQRPGVIPVRVERVP